MLDAHLQLIENLRHADELLRGHLAVHLGFLQLLLIVLADGFAALRARAGVAGLVHGLPQTLVLGFQLVDSGVRLRR